MLHSLQTSATGMKAQQLIVDNISHNLANANTTSYKKSRLEFQDLLYLELGKADGKADPEKQVTSGLQIGSGVRSVANLKNFSQGRLEETLRELDIAIKGDGFFQVTQGNDSSEIFYTRDGSFKIDSEGKLVTSSGNLVYPPITFPENTEKIYFGKDGLITVKITGQEELQTLGEIKLARFSNTMGLSNEGENLYKKTAASGDPTVNKPGEEGAGILVQNFLERSNVEVVNEMVNLIMAQRAYEINSKVIRTGDEMLSMANNLIR